MPPRSQVNEGFRRTDGGTALAGGDDESETKNGVGKREEANMNYIRKHQTLKTRQVTTTPLHPHFPGRRRKHPTLACRTPYC